MKTLILTGIALMLCIGCRQNNRTSLPYAGKPPTGIISWSSVAEESPVAGVDEVQLLYFGKAVVVWTDYPPNSSAASIAYGSGEGQVGGGGQLTNTQYGLLEFVCQLDTETTGTVTLSGQNYNLSKGGLFLVSVRGGERRIEQIACDLGAIEMSQKGFKSLLDSQPEIKQFFEATPEEK